MLLLLIFILGLLDWTFLFERQVDSWLLGSLLASIVLPSLAASMLVWMVFVPMVVTILLAQLSITKVLGSMLMTNLLLASLFEATLIWQELHLESDKTKEPQNSQTS